MTWDYRVVRKRSEATGEHGYGVHEVYHDANGRIFACTVDPVAPSGGSVDELREDLEFMRSALQEPVLDYDDVPEEGAVNPMDAVDLDNITTDGGAGWAALKRKFGL